MKSLATKFFVAAALGVVLLWACTGPSMENSVLEVGDLALTRPFETCYRADFEEAYGVPGKPLIIAEEHFVAEKVLELLNQELTAKAVANRRELMEQAVHYVGAKVAPEGSFLVLRNGKYHFLDHEVRDAPGAILIKSLDEKAVGRWLRQLPDAYRFYFRSLFASREDAVQLCEALLALPPDERRNLTVLAAYRIARLQLLQLDREQDELTEDELLAQLVLVRKNLEQVAVLIKEGYPDWANFAKASEGWLAYTYGFIEADFAKALQLYLKLYREGDATAKDSITFLGVKLMSFANDYTSEILSDKHLTRLVILQMARGITAVDFGMDEELVSPELQRSRFKTWIKLLASQPNLEPFDRIRIALAEYREGLWEECAKTLKQCPADDPMVKLLQARLLLREGKRLDAMKVLQEQVQPKQQEVLKELHYQALMEEGSTDDVYVFPYYFDGPLDQVTLLPKFRSEYANLLLSQGQYEEALNLFLRTGLWRDAYYIGECVLTIDELEKLVKRDWPEIKKANKTDDVCLEKDATTEIRFLLARRLFRAGLWQKSEAYFPEELRHVVAEYRGYIFQAINEKNPPKLRADAYWRAALTISREGENLLFCNFGLSWSSTFGDNERWYEVPSTLPRIRIQPIEEDPESLIAPPSADEVKRVQDWMTKNLDQPTRAHRDARYEVARLGVLAAELLPTDDEAGAKILQYCGNLIKYREPKAAQPIYRLLATKFKGTSLGQRARKLHWFAADRLEANPDWVQKER